MIPPETSALDNSHCQLRSKWSSSWTGHHSKNKSRNVSVLVIIFCWTCKMQTRIRKSWCIHFYTIQYQDFNLFSKRHVPTRHMLSFDLFLLNQKHWVSWHWIFRKRMTNNFCTFALASLATCTKKTDVAVLNLAFIY